MKFILNIICFSLLISNILVAQKTTGIEYELKKDSINDYTMYINKAIDIMEQNSIRKDSVDWSKMRAESLNLIKKENTQQNAYQLIRNNLLSIGDNHSSFRAVEYLEKIYSDKNDLPLISFDKINEQIGYVRIPSFEGNNEQAIELAINIQEAIRTLDSEKTDKWIIDLTYNRGGNMWPMYLGLTPILKEGVSGYFVNAEGEFLEWRFDGNAVYEKNRKVLELKKSYQIKSKNPKIAILIDMWTASSAEAIAIMFKAFPNTQFFGVESRGLSTGNETYELSDGAKIFLTTSIMSDRTKRKYGKKIKPDIDCLFPKKDAVEWLMKK